MDKIIHQVRVEHWAKIPNECMNSEMSKTAWCRANGITEKQFFYCYFSHPRQKPNETRALVKSAENKSK